MAEESDLLSALPRTRPHRRSGKRPARATAAPATPTVPADAQPTPPVAKPSAAKPRPAKSSAAKPHAAKGHVVKPRPIEAAGAGARARSASKPLRQPAQPAGSPSRGTPSKPVPPSSRNVLGTAVQAAAELTEIGLVLSARAMRNAVSRLPRP